eukprot:gb/GEZN01001217.1/.p1 GENE.gb/GEZN01001217.1/~~gb/GEZN01001217.1/.p1  ORF type:complete len:1001 (+),score=92.68 gb/GEZN01001217.1/:37-3039(+)
MARGSSELPSSCSHPVPALDFVCSSSTCSLSSRTSSVLSDLRSLQKMRQARVLEPNSFLAHCLEHRAELTLPRLWAFHNHHFLPLQEWLRALHELDSVSPVLDQGTKWFVCLVRASRTSCPSVAQCVVETLLSLAFPHAPVPCFRLPLLCSTPQLPRTKVGQQDHQVPAQDAYVSDARRVVTLLLAKHDSSIGQNSLYFAAGPSSARPAWSELFKWLVDTTRCLPPEPKQHALSWLLTHFLHTDNTTSGTKAEAYHDKEALVESSSLLQPVLSSLCPSDVSIALLQACKSRLLSLVQAKILFRLLGRGQHLSISPSIPWRVGGADGEVTVAEHLLAQSGDSVSDSLRRHDAPLLRNLLGLFRILCEEHEQVIKLSHSRGFMGWFQQHFGPSKCLKATIPATTAAITWSGQGDGALGVGKRRRKTGTQEQEVSFGLVSNEEQLVFLLETLLEMVPQDPPHVLRTQARTMFGLWGVIAAHMCRRAKTLMQEYLSRARPIQQHPNLNDAGPAVSDHTIEQHLLNFHRNSCAIPLTLRSQFYFQSPQHWETVFLPAVLRYQPPPFVCNGQQDNIDLKVVQQLFLEALVNLNMASPKLLLQLAPSQSKTSTNDNLQPAGRDGTKNMQGSGMEQKQAKAQMRHRQCINLSCANSLLECIGSCSSEPATWAERMRACWENANPSQCASSLLNVFAKAVIRWPPLTRDQLQPEILAFARAIEATPSLTKNYLALILKESLCSRLPKNVQSCLEQHQGSKQAEAINVLLHHARTQCLFIAILATFSVSYLPESEILLSVFCHLPIRTLFDQDWFFFCVSFFLDGVLLVSSRLCLLESSNQRKLSNQGQRLRGLSTAAMCLLSCDLLRRVLWLLARRKFALSLSPPSHLQFKTALLRLMQLFPDLSASGTSSINDKELMMSSLASTPFGVLAAQAGPMSVDDWFALENVAQFASGPQVGDEHSQKEYLTYLRCFLQSPQNRPRGNVEHKHIQQLLATHCPGGELSFRRYD